MSRMAGSRSMTPRKRAMPPRIGGLRAREQLVPAGKAGCLTVGDNRVDRALRRKCAIVGDTHGFAGLGRDQHFRLLLGWALVEMGGKGIERRADLLRCTRPRVFDQGAPFTQIERDVLARVPLLGQIARETPVRVDPRRDGKAVATNAGNRHFGRPPVISQFAHRLPLPAASVLGPEQQFGAKHGVALGEDVGLDRERVANRSLGRKLPEVDHRCNCLDDNARLLRRQLGCLHAPPCAARGPRAPGALRCRNSVNRDFVHVRQTSCECLHRTPRRAWDVPRRRRGVAVPARFIISEPLRAHLLKTVRRALVQEIMSNPRKNSPHEERNRKNSVDRHVFCRTTPIVGKGSRRKRANYAE